MQKITITLSVDDDRLEALQIYLKKENTTVQKKMSEVFMQLYEKTVPEQVQEFLTDRAAARSKRPSRPTASKSALAPKPEKEEKPNGRS